MSFKFQTVYLFIMICFSNANLKLFDITNRYEENMEQCLTIVIFPTYIVHF